VMVSAPLMVWLYDRTFVAGTFWGALRSRWRVYLGLGSSWVLLAWLVMRAGELGSEGAGFQTSVGWGSYGLTQLWAVVHYLRLSVWPYPLVFDYGKMLVTGVPQVGWAALVVGTLISGTMASLARWPTLGFLGCWFLVILAPTTSVLPLAGQTVAEHRMYLSLAAVVTAIVLGFYAWLGRRSRGLFVILAIMLGLLTARRNEDYSNKVSIWRDTVAKCPDNLRARNNLGAALLELGRVAEAMGEYQEIVRIKPDQAEAHMYLGAALLQQARFPEAIEQLEQALRLKGGVAEVHNNLGAALFRMGRVSEAIAHYEEALRLRPQDAVAHMNLGVALYEQGQVSEAIQQWEEALKLRPDYAEAHLNLGVALGQLGQGAGAVAHLEQALRLKPGDVSVRSRFAWVLATCEGGSVRNGPRAVELAEGANRLVDGKDPGILTTLAAAYAEAGRFGEATSSARQALELAIAAHNATLASELRVQIGLYQAGTPLRETSLTNAAAVRNSLVPSRK
jgi:Flp pilus assembly protein TadD